MVYLTSILFSCYYVKIIGIPNSPCLSWPLMKLKMGRITKVTCAASAGLIIIIRGQQGPFKLFFNGLAQSDQQHGLVSPTGI